MTSATTEQALAEAVRLYRAGDHAEALRLTTQAVDRDPGHAEAALELARLLGAMRRHDEAEVILRRALGASPGHFGLATNLGIMLCQTGRESEGIDWLQRAAVAQPRSPMAQFNLANALKAVGRIDAAIEGYRAAIGNDAGYAPAHANLGNALIQLGRIDEGAAEHQKATELRRSPGVTPARGDDLLTHTTPSKLLHDIEQLEHLLSRGIIGPDYEAVLADYRAALVALPAGSSGTALVDLPPGCREKLAATYNRLWHKYEAPALSGGALNPALDRVKIEADYFSHHPGIAYFDGLLRPEALAGLRRFCLESTFWFQFKYANGYLGAFMEDAFWCPLLSQVTEELRLAFPAIFKHHTLRKCWAFKYDSRLSGIPMHADFAAVNVNFWITPDSANLDPAHGGLIVWDKEAPADWDFAAYNRDVARMRAFLNESGAKPVIVPHRQNRMVMFNSDLIHETDLIAFADGYENRRINITLLYGSRNG
jgi:tetratricopeptide (TPR) repeat protein